MSNKKLLRIAGLMFVVVTLSFAKLFASTIIVNSNIATNTTWTNNNKYIITGFVYVTNGATLTINAGTWIQGDSATKGSLIVTRGSKISAIGTPCSPIVFTSEKSAGHRARGDWGGVILLGYAAVNWPGDTGHIEGIVPNPNTLYGGGLNPNFSNTDHPVDADNSGTMEYCRIEFAGIALSPNNEINGLTFGGVGNGTTIDHIQVSYSNDDSYEWFGGHVDCKYMVAYDGIDDDWDTDNGFSGRVQFGISMRDPNVADVSGSKNFESDNDPNGDTNTPQTSVVFQNMTTLGGASITVNPLFTQNAHIRRNSACKVYNSILMGFPQGILVDGSLTIANCAASSFFKNDYVEQATGNYRGYTPSGDPNQAAADANLAGNGNVYSTQYTGVLTDPNFPASSDRDFIPSSGNPLPSSNTSLYSGGFWTSVSYVGALNPDGSDHNFGDWTNFDPVNTTYAVKINYAPSIASATITNSICPNTGGVDISVSGGIPTYNYVWSNGVTTQDLTNVSKATYTVTVFDAGHNCSAAAKKYKVVNELPILTSCSSTSTSITIFWAGNLAGSVTGYSIHFKKHSSSTYGSYLNVGNGNSTTITGLLTNTQYDFQLRGNCISGHTGISTALTCSTTARLANENNNGQVMSIYPNPSTGQFKIDLNGFAPGSMVSVKVSNVLGEVVYSVANVSTDASIDVDLKDFSSGMYNVIVSDGTNHLTQNIILNK